MRLIDADALKEDILGLRDCDNGFSDTYDKACIIGMIDEQPTAEPETAKRIVGRSRDGMTLWYQCDMCNEPVDAQDNFCRGCGRRLIDG